jgi:colicin import membrane protein
MKLRLTGALLVVVATLFAASAFGAPDIETQQGRDVERTRIELERTAAEAKFEEQDLECKTRFVVTSCRNNVRLERMRSQDAFKRQEAILNKLDRQAAAVRQQQKIDEKANH